MAKKSRFTIILPKEKSPVARISTYSENVQSGLSTHTTDFAEPSPSVRDLEEATIAMNTADVAPSLANDASRLELERRKKIVLEILTKLAAYVIGVAKGDRYVAALSGFELSKEETSKQETGDIVIDEVSVGSNDGEAIIRLADRGGYTMFIVERKTAEGDWLMIGAFQLRSFTLKNLPSGASVIRITGYKSDVPGKTVETVVKAV